MPVAVQPSMAQSIYDRIRNSSDTAKLGIVAGFAFSLWLALNKSNRKKFMEYFKLMWK